MVNNKYEIVVYGATSFVGKILCQYLVDECTEADLRWAIAGRSETKLKDLKQALGKDNLDYLIADSEDETALRDMCNQTSVVISTVGPYALYGETLIRACAVSGTDYCDLTGEAQWISRMIKRYGETAKNSGARLVNSCGFDSIPSDLGVLFLQNMAQERFRRYCLSIKMRVQAMQGGASGGTIASGINLYKEAAKDPELRKELADWYSLCEADHGMTSVQRDVGVEQDEQFKSWVGPFVMAAINMRIVFRSVSLLGNPYGENFRYDEAMMTGPGSDGQKRAKRLAQASKYGAIAMTISPIRWLAQRFLPKPGEGPSPEQQLNGFFDLRFIGETEAGDQLRVKVTGDRDPGYGSTAKMLAQAGICLARDIRPSTEGGVAGGFHTPASSMGERLITRLGDYAGLEFGFWD